MRIRGSVSCCFLTIYIPRRCPYVTDVFILKCVPAASVKPKQPPILSLSVSGKTVPTVPVSGSGSVPEPPWAESVEAGFPSSNWKFMHRIFWKSVAIVCSNDNLAVAMPFAMKNGQMCISLRKCFVFSFAVQHGIASEILRSLRCRSGQFWCFLVVVRYMLVGPDWLSADFCVLTNDWEKTESAWKRLKVTENEWKWLKPSESDWDRLKVCENTIAVKRVTDRKTYYWNCFAGSYCYRFGKMLNFDFLCRSYCFCSKKWIARITSIIFPHQKVAVSVSEKSFPNEFQ